MYDMEELFDKMLSAANKINLLLKEPENEKNSHRIIDLFNQKKEFLEAAIAFGKKNNKDNKIFSDISSNKLNEYKRLEEENLSLIQARKSLLADKLKKQAQQKSLLIYSKR
jgi:hypothetical protein